MEEGADTPVDREEATAFVALLLRTVKEKDVPIYVVLTMRSDFLGDCAFFANLPEALNEGQFLTPRLSFDQRRESIEAPARVEEGEVAPDLTLRLLNDMGTGPDQLPLMQHALMRVWSMARARDPSTPPTLTLKDYLDGGGLEQALSKHADAAFDKLTDRQKAIAERLFRALSGGNTGRRDTRRPTKLGMIADVAGVTPEAVAEVVEFFRGGDLNLLSPARTPRSRLHHRHQPREPDPSVDPTQGLGQERGHLRGYLSVAGTNGRPLERARRRRPLDRTQPRQRDRVAGEGKAERGLGVSLRRWLCPRPSVYRSEPGKTTPRPIGEGTCGEARTVVEVERAARYRRRDRIRYRDGISVLGIRRKGHREEEFTRGDHRGRERSQSRGNSQA